MIQRPVRIDALDRRRLVDASGHHVARAEGHAAADEIARCINHHTPEREAAVEELRAAAKDFVDLRMNSEARLRLRAALAKLDEMEGNRG